MFTSKQISGNRGEDIAVSYLQKKGFQIIERNFRIRGGEIDIIAIEGDTLVFIEVKARLSTEYGSPFEAITPWKLKSVIKTAQFYKMKHRELPEALRIDAIGIKFFDSGGKEFEVEHLRNVGY